MLKFYNHLSRKKEPFKPIRKDRIGLYTCGPTVYNYAHIGNLRTYIFEDVLKRALEYSGMRVRHVMNITDVDDKIIRDAARAGQSIFEFVKPYEAVFFKDLTKLNIEKAWKYPKATGHIKEMIALIGALLKKGLAYSSGGSVYFDISKFKKYGRLSRIRTRTLKAGARVDTDEYDKNDVRDFVLWKAAKEGEPSWDAPFGKGRPGWHIECSAMSMKYLGETFDIHAGGVDLLFPHHENEIAQSEGATGKPFVRYFVEGEHLLVNGAKMSKSLGNVYTLRDIETKRINPLAFRYLILTSHYRSKLNFTWESLQGAQNSLERLHEFIRALILGSPTSLGLGSRTSKFQTRFVAALSNDLDTPKALAVVWQLIRDYHKNPRAYNSKTVLKLLYDFDTVLGLGLKGIKAESVPTDIKKLADRREEYRKNKQWAEADSLRKKIEKMGYLVTDGSNGPILQKKIFANGDK